MDWVTVEKNVQARFLRQNELVVKNGEEIPGDEHVFVEVRIVGSSDKFGKALKTERALKLYSEKYPTAYKAFMEGEEAAPDGTDITELAGISGDLANRWKAMGVRTVEELADASDAVLQRLGQNARAFHRQAKEKLELEELRAQKAMVKKFKEEEADEQEPARDNASSDGLPSPRQAKQHNRRKRTKHTKNARNSESSGAGTSEA